MTAEVVSLQGARVERDERFRALIADGVAKLTADLERYGEALTEWLLRVTPEQKGELARDLASEIIVRYSPIARQFRALYDVIELHVAAAHLANEDLSQSVLLALTLTMNDERYIELAKHIGRESVVRDYPESAEEIRRKSPSVVDAACDRVFEHYAAMRKK